MSFRVALVSTGGTIEKTYDELDGMLVNEVSNLDVVLARIVLTGVSIVRVPLMNKDSRDMTEEDHDLIARTAEVYSAQHDGVVIVHGTDRLATTGNRIAEHVKPRVPVVLTGAMRPYQLRNTDAVQNVTEALMAVQLASPGVYVALHNRLHPFPGANHARRRGTFVMEYVTVGRRSSPGSIAPPPMGTYDQWSGD
ncbi:MAG: asparaginase domain-containing protein [Myxococcota bacterium]